MPKISMQEAKQKSLPTSGIQTIQIPKSKFSIKQAKEWLKTHKYRYDTWRYTPEFYRFMQNRPVENANYYSKKLPNGIILTFMN